MLRAVPPVIACLGMLTIVACGGRDPVAKEANNTAGLPAINDAVPDPTGSPPEKARPASEASRPRSTAAGG